MQINPTAPQWRFISTESKYPAFVGGFGSGKTEALINRVIIMALQSPLNNIAFYEPTYDLVRMIAWPRFEEKLTALGVKYQLIKSPLNVIKIEGAGEIIFRSMDAPQRIVGYQVADSAIDELDTLKAKDAEYAFRQIMARNRQHKKDGKPNTIAVATTPEGFRFVYNRWGKNGGGDYELIKAPTTSNPYLPADYVDNLRALYPEHLLDAYINGDFVNLTSGTVYKSYNRAAHRSTETIRDGETLYIGMDFNVTKQAATAWVKRNGGDQWHAVAELVDMYDTPEAVTIITEKWKSKGHGIVIYPDASGASRKSVNASTSDIALLRQAGFEVRVKSKNPSVKDRINATNAAFDSGRLHVNDVACPTTANCLEQQSYNKNGEPDKASGNDHQNDATTYPVVYEFPIIRPVADVSVRFTI